MRLVSNTKSAKTQHVETKNSQPRGAQPSGVPRFLTVQEVAAMLRLSPKTIYKMVSGRRIPFRKPGGHLLFEVSEIEAWTKTGTDNR